MILAYALNYILRSFNCSRCRMEESTLNFEKKILSARHLTSGAAPENGSKWRIEDSVRSMRRPPPFKSELKSGPVRNPGTVPFEWEHIPGRPKDDETRSNLHVAESYRVPKLPPGRTLSVGQRDLDKASGNPVVQKDQTRGLSHESWNLQCADEIVQESGSLREEANGVENCSSGNDEKFVDALETLSRAESSLINCSLSGLSGMEDSVMKVSLDSQTRDFMMGRFLPAAKAMTSETPQHVPRKPPVVRQEWTQLGKMVNEDKKTQLRYGPDFALQYLQQNGNGDEENDVESDEGENFSGKVCGFLPGLGFRTSFCFLNPLPGISMRNSAPVSPLRKPQSKASSWACSEADLKIKSHGLEISKHKTMRKALENNDIPIPYLSLDDVDSPMFSEVMAVENQSKYMGIEGRVAEKTLYVDTEHKVRSLHVKSCASDTNRQTELQVKRHGSLAEKDQNQLVDASPVNTEKLDLTKRGAKSETQFEMPDFHIVMQKSSTKEQDIFKGSNRPEDEFSMLYRKGPLKSESKIYSELPAPPPLPKSPADSWLGRTLHSISTKNASVHSYRGTWVTPKDQENKLKSLHPKWETMVRMTKMQDKHSFFSEDRLTPIPEA